MRRALSRRTCGALSITVLLTSLAGLPHAGVNAAMPVARGPQRVGPSSAVVDTASGIIVGMAADVSPSSSGLSRVAGASVRVQRPLAKRTFVTRLSGRRSVAEVQAMADRIAAMPGVAFAVPDRRMRAAFIPNDPLWAYQWDMNAPTSKDIGANLPGAWSITRGASDVVVAVIDTGITYHPDLAGQTLPGFDFVTNPLIGNDGDGRDSNPSDPGDWISPADDAGSTAGGYFADCGVSTSSWHGTHVSGTIAAKGNNSTGISGAAPGVKLLPVRVLGKCGGDTSDVIDGMRWAAGLSVDGVPPNPNPASILNISLGGSGACDPAEQAAIDEITSMGVSVVVAAGNEGGLVTYASPASCVGVIAVGATDRTGDLAFYSNYSDVPAGGQLTLSAPGGDTTADTVSATPAGRGGIRSTFNTGLTSPGLPGYEWYEGTSMAAPHVAGVAALVKSVWPSLSPAGMSTMLRSKSRPFKAGTDCALYDDCGAGILDASNTVTAARAAYGARVLGAFSKTSPLPGAVSLDHTITLQWSASTGANGYEYCIVVGTATPCTGWVRVGNVLSTTVRGLSADTVYAWQVRATGTAGIAEANASVRSSFSTTSTAFPGAMDVPEATPRDGAVALRWSPPAFAGGAPVVDYVVEYSTDSGSSWTTVVDGLSTELSTTVESLTNGVPYIFHMAATTTLGTGFFGAATGEVTPSATGLVSLEPTGVTATPGNGSMALSWTAPTDAGDSAISDYAVQYSSNGGATWTAYVDAVSTSTATTVPGLSNGTGYIFRVAAVNGAGEGVFSLPTGRVVPHTLPSRVATPVATAAAASVVLSWREPSNGGSRLLTYRLQYSGDNGVHWSTPVSVGSTTLSRKFTGLVNGRRYLFRAAAVSAVGAGAYSMLAAAVPAAVPSAPAAPLVSSSLGRVSLQWSAPAGNGAAITDYVVQYSSNNGSTWTTYADGVSAARTATLVLRRGVTYRYRVAAVNRVGRGAFSAASVANKLR